RDELLAGARLAVDEHGEIGGRDALDAIEDHAHRGAPADEWAERKGALGLHALRRRRLERELDAADDDRRALHDKSFDDANACDPNAVLASEVADANAAIGCDELRVKLADLLVRNDEIARCIAADEDGHRSDPHALDATTDGREHASLNFE